MPEDLSREIRKLEVRLIDFFLEEKEFGEELKRYIKEIKTLNDYVDKIELEVRPNEIVELKNLRLKVIEAFNDALIKQSKVEHEKSHLLESYGALFLALERKIQESFNQKNEK